MKLQVFNGGINTRLAPHLIGVTEAVSLTNVDTETGILAPVTDNTVTATAVNTYFTEFNGSYISSATETTYVEYRDKLYWVDGAAPKKYDGTNTYKLGIDKPATAPTVALDGATATTMSGTYSYVVTFYNNSDGTESVQSAISAEVAVTNQAIDLSAIPVSTDPQVSHVRIYRIGGGLTVFTLVDSITNGTTTYKDILADNAVEGTLLATTNNYPCPTNAKYITVASSIFFVATGTTVRWSVIGNPNYWPLASEIEFPYTVTGIVEVGEGVLVFTEQSTWLLVGTATDSIVRYPVSGDQGCLSHFTIAKLGNGALFVSADGICSSTGTNVEVVSKAKFGKLNISAVNACLHDEVYYVHQTNGKTLALDMRYEAHFKELNLGITKIANINDTLYGVVDGKLATLFTSGTNLTMTYLSPVLIEASYSEVKLYNVIYVRSTGTITMTVYIDGTLVHTESITSSGTTEVFLPQSSQRGYSMQVGITGTGTVYELEYKPLGRQNGR